MNFFNWLKTIHSNSDDASSKRFYGGIAWIAIIILTYLTAYKFVDIEVWRKMETFITTITLLATGLLGLDTVKNGIQYFKKDKKDDKPTQSS